MNCCTNDLIFEGKRMKLWKTVFVGAVMSAAVASTQVDAKAEVKALNDREMQEVHGAAKACVTYTYNSGHSSQCGPASGPDDGVMEWRGSGYYRCGDWPWGSCPPYKKYLAGKLYFWGGFNTCPTDLDYAEIWDTECVMACDGAELCPADGHL